MIHKSILFDSDVTQFSYSLFITLKQNAMKTGKNVMF